MKPERPPFRDNIMLQLENFTREVWSKSSRVLLIHPNLKVEYIDLGKYFQAFRSLFPASVMYYDKILVRQEYRDALKALKEGTLYKRGAYVTGQPGIGKTLFLIYILVISLGEKRTVALEFPDGRPFYALFQESGFSIHALNDGLQPIDDLPNSSDFMWALSDSNYKTGCPSPIFLSEPDNIRIIQTTPPREERWKRWSKEAGTRCYVMDLWTPEEIKTLANLLSINVNRMAFLGERWGYNPRNLLGFIKDCRTDLQIETMYKKDAPSVVAKSEAVILSITQNALSVNAPSDFFFCRPMPILNSESIVHRTITCAVVPTENICNVLGEALQQHDINVRLSFFRALSQHNETRSSARYIYEHWFHSYFATGKPIQCRWVSPKANHSSVRLTGTPKVAPSMWSALSSRDPPFFWVAPKNTPGIDSVLVLEDAICVVQVTISSTHVSPIDGMKKVRQYLDPRLRDVTWKVIFVGQESSEITSVANSWANKLFFPTNRTKVHIAWAAVDPVVKGVHFTNFHREQESGDGARVELAEQGSSSKGKKRHIGEVAKPDEAPTTSRTRSKTKGTRTKT